MEKNKKLFLRIGVLLMFISILIGMLIFLLGRLRTEREEGWSSKNLRKGLETAVEYDKQYNSYIASEQEALAAIKEYGILQRQNYSNRKVEKVEHRMEADYAICAVNLGEMQQETAEDIERAFGYMYDRYPKLRGTLTNISVGNFEGKAMSYIALTQSRVFVVHETEGVYPYVVKHEIILNAAKFFEREKLLAECSKQTENGHWPEKTDISSLVVHELGHHLLSVAAMEYYGLEKGYYITEDKADAYSRYVTDSLAEYQTFARETEDAAYEIWKGKYNHKGDRETFRESISLYAKGVQEDGGISYGETFAEAMADLYLHGENAKDASKSMEEALERRWKNNGL